MSCTRALQLGCPGDQINVQERDAAFFVHMHLTAHTNVDGALQYAVGPSHTVTECPHKALHECNAVGSCHRPITSNTACMT